MAVSALEALALLVGAGALALSLTGTWQAARWSGASLAPAGPWRPRVSVIVPCRGEHAGFEANAQALVRQRYPAYEVLFVLDEPDDPSAPYLMRLRSGVPRVRVMLSQPDAVGPGWATGKIVAQLTGVRHADPGSEVLVFADADARPTPDWLASLVSPLSDPSVGGVTGYRWYTAASAPSPWTALRDAWNAVGLDAMFMARFRFLWGGSMAVRRRDFERSDVREAWRRMVSEDVGLTRAMQGLGLGIAFAPGALVASPEDWSRAQVKEWITRQAALTRHAMPALYAFAVAVYGLSLALLAVGLVLVLAAPSVVLTLAGALMLAPVLGALPRAVLRERLVRRSLPLVRVRPIRERVLQLAFAPVVGFAMLGALAAAREVQVIQWRGRTYALRGPDAASRARTRDES